MSSLIAHLLRPTRYEDGLTILDPDYRSLGDGERFSLRYRVDGVTSGTSEYVRLTVPSDGNEVTGIVRQIGGSGEIRGRVATEFTVDAAGTDETPRNDNINLSNAPTSSVQAQTGGSYTISGNPQPLFSPGGVTGAATGSVGPAIAARAQPGTDIVYELTPQFDGGSVFFSIVWTEDAA